MPYHELFLLLTGVWIVGRVFDRLRWPAIFGEIGVGIILGPALLGLVHETEAIKTLAELGIFFLMLHAGLEADPQELSDSFRKSSVIAIGGIVASFFGGYYCSVLFGYGFVESIFIGMGLSITALAVSAKVFKDYKMQRSQVAHVTMGAAIISDIIGLLLFSIVLNIAEQGSVDWYSILVLMSKIIVFFAVVLYVGHKYFKNLNKILYTGNKGFTFTIILALAFGLFAEMIGVHIIVGAFLAGLFIREELIESTLFKKIEDRVYGLSYSLFGPIFFASLAFYLDFSALQTSITFTGVIVLAAVLGKVVGSGLPAYFSGMTKTESFGVGLAMNSRGVVELIIAMTGLEKGIISKEVFSILVIVAFVSTLFSILSLKPLSKFFRKRKKPQGKFWWFGS